jgi:hypothetical protein
MRNPNLDEYMSKHQTAAQKSDDHEDEDEEESSVQEPTSGPGSVYSSTDHTGKHSTHSSTSSLSLARAETRWVRRIKVLVLVVMALAAATCSVLTYIFVQASERQSFEHQVSTWETIQFRYMQLYSTFVLDRAHVWTARHSFSQTDCCVSLVCNGSCFSHC